MRPLETRTLRERRAAARRRAGRRRLALLVVALAALAAGLGALATGTDEPASLRAAAPPVAQAALGPLEAPVATDTVDEVRVRFRRPPRGGLLLDLDTGQVLWRRHATRARPVASLTKMMTALVAARALAPDDRAPITRRVLDYTGSGMGVLRPGTRVGVEKLLIGLLLPSGNDAARALALRASDSLGGFVREMNAHAARLGLTCTRFAGVEGLSERNVSCPRDLAALAGHLLDEPRLARIVRRPRAIIPMPVEGGRAFLYNHNPLVRQRYRGVLGVKTGYTGAAGRCLVAAARRHGHRLVAVVLHSPDPGRQAQQLLDRGFAAIRR